jgi:hypothetical protein
VIYASNKTADFRIALPFLFTNAVSGEDLTDIHVGTPQSGINYLFFGNKMKSERKINLDTASGFISPAVSYDFSGRSVSNAGTIYIFLGFSFLILLF